MKATRQWEWSDNTKNRLKIHFYIITEQPFLTGKNEWYNIMKTNASTKVSLEIFWQKQVHGASKPVASANGFLLVKKTDSKI